jgi:hypothetical protein
LSKWWSWLRSTTSTWPSDSRAIAGSANFLNVYNSVTYSSPAGSNVGSVSSLNPPDSSSAVGPPM